MLPVGFMHVKQLVKTFLGLPSFKVSRNTPLWRGQFGKEQGGERRGLSQSFDTGSDLREIVHMQFKCSSLLHNC